MLLTADAAAANHWITVQPQYRMGSPSGYAVLHYDSAPQSLPLEPTPQPGAVSPWSLRQLAQVQAVLEVMPASLQSFQPAESEMNLRDSRSTQIPSARFAEQ